MPSWGKMFSSECLHVGTRDHEDPDTAGYYRASVRAVLKAARALHDEDGVPPGRIIIGGFSQGAAVALQAALTGASSFAGCIVLSGWLTPFARSVLSSGALGTSRPAVLLFHGSADALVGLDCAEFAAAALTAGSATVR
jgi:predicted esterase